MLSIIPLTEVTQKLIIWQEASHTSHADCNNNNYYEYAYAGTTDCFTHLGILVVLQAPTHFDLPY
jgi:hypothetical protein